MIYCAILPPRLRISPDPDDCLKKKGLYDNHAIEAWMSLKGNVVTALRAIDLHTTFRFPRVRWPQAFGSAVSCGLLVVGFVTGAGERRLGSANVIRLGGWSRRSLFSLHISVIPPRRWNSGGQWGFCIGWSYCWGRC
jgi:hypothetical protein